jgi:hypothetical protein
VAACSSPRFAACTRRSFGPHDLGGVRPTRFSQVENQRQGDSGGEQAADDINVGPWHGGHDLDLRRQLKRSCEPDRVTLPWQVVENPPPAATTQCPSKKWIFSGASCSRDGSRAGRSPASRDRSGARAARLADRTEANVAAASTNVPAAVASEETVAQSTTRTG